jgi:hypothetical protein
MLLPLRLLLLRLFLLLLLHLFISGLLLLLQRRRLQCCRNSFSSSSGSSGGSSSGGRCCCSCVSMHSPVCNSSDYPLLLSLLRLLQQLGKPCPPLLSPGLAQVYPPNLVLLSCHWSNLQD